MPTPFILNIGGANIPLAGVSLGPTRKADRPSSDLITLGGTRYMRFAQRAPRTWALAYAGKDPSAVAWLRYAANGEAGTVWLLDRAAARANMLDPRTTYGLDAAQPTIVGPAGVPMRTFGAIPVFTRMVRQDLWYHLSGWTTRTAATQLGVLTVGAEAPVSVVAPTGAGPRRWSIAFKPVADSTVSFNVTTAAVTTALRLTESSVDSFPWIDGMNTPCKVAISDPDETLSLFQEDRPPVSDYTVTVWEVG